MKRLVAFVLLFSASVLQGAELYRYSGVFPANPQKVEGAQFLVMMNDARKVFFQVLDEKNQVTQAVRVVEVAPSGGTVKARNENGIQAVDIAEPGIYDVQVMPAVTDREVRFVLRVLDFAEAPAGTPVMALNTGSAAPAGAAPVVAAQTPPALSLPVQPPALTVAPTEPVKPAPVATAPRAPVVPPEAPAMEAPRTTPALSEVTITRRTPSGDGYADPYKPVEVEFSADLPADVVPEKVLRVQLVGNAGQEIPVDGRWMKAGARVLRFLPARYIPGAVYHVIVTPSGDKREEFRFSVLPDVKMGVEETGADISISLTWPELKELYPSAEGQVTRLEFAELSIISGGSSCWSLKLDDSLPPVGEANDSLFQGEPFRFVVRVPKSRLYTSDGTFDVALDAAFAGRDKRLRFRKTTLKNVGAVTSVPPAFSAPAAPASATVSPAVGTVVSPVKEPEPVQPPVITPEPATEKPVAGASPAGSLPPLPPIAPLEPETVKEPVSPVTSPVKEPVKPVVSEPIKVVKPVVAIADPGPLAIPVATRDISLSENNLAGSHVWPKGLHWAPDGALWAVDSQGRRVLRFSEDGTLLNSFGGKAEKGVKAAGTLKNPVDVVSGDAGVFISDTAAHCVHLYKLDGSHIRDIGTWGTKRGQMDLPHGIDYVQEQLWVADRGNSQIMRFGSDGTFRGGFGSKGELPGYLTNPVSVRVVPDGCWVLEGASGRLQKFDREGRLKLHFLSGAKDPNNLAVDPWGYLWITDGEGHNVKRFDNRGKGIVSLEPRLGGQPWIPTSVAVRADGLIAVGDAANRLIRLFRLQKP